MPANSLYGDIDPTMVSNSNIPLQQPAPHPTIEDTRALSLALEMMHNDSLINTFGVMNTYDDPTLLATMTDAERANKRSQNMTECVAVPSSEHVAEIVGRQGCKIKALRAKTNTYIKTPVRGEEPVFVVTGRKEDVANAKREILSAADHFSQIRACRKNNLNGSMAPGPPTNVPGQITISVRVPYRVVGLVVGPKGATIKRIQQQTTTYIVTPSRDKEPVFEVTGMPESVEAAKKEIEAHIAMRTGTLFDDENFANFAATHNISIESLVNNPEVINYFRSQPSMSNGVSTASLNALLSTTSNHHGLGQSLSSNGLSGALSSSSQLGLSNGHSTGMQTPFTNGFSGIGGSSNNLPSVTDSTLASLFVPRTSNNLLTSNLSLSDFGMSSLANSLGGANTYTSNFDLNSGAQHNSVPSTHLGEGTSSYRLLGEAANNLLNSKGIGSIDHTRAAALFAANLANRSGQPQPKYCLDEGFNSLSSSMGSSPALDQPQQTHATNIWSDTRYSTSSLGLNFPSHHHFASGSNTPTLRQSPTHHLSHSPARRSNSDPSHIQEMCSVFSKLSANAALARSSSTSPELLDFSSALPNSLVSSACSSLFQGASSSARTSPITTAAAMAASVAAAATAAEEASDFLANLTQVSSSFAGTTPTTSSTEGPFSSPSIASVVMMNGGDSRRGSFDLTLVNDGDASKAQKECWSCHTTQVDGVFIPCGHNHYCLNCATKINEREPKCPSCQGKIDNVFQIRH